MAEPRKIKIQGLPPEQDPLGVPGKQKNFIYEDPSTIWAPFFPEKNVRVLFGRIVVPFLAEAFRNFRTFLVESGIFEEFRTVVRTAGLRRQ